MRRGLLRPLSGRERVLVVMGVTLVIAGGFGAGSAGSASELVRNPDGALVDILSVVSFVLGLGILIGARDRPAVPIAVLLYVLAYGAARWIA
jgi:hypothetical protein